MLLKSLKPEVIVELFAAMLLERKIVLVKAEIGDIALIMQALICLMNPFKWHFTIITYLDDNMVDFLDAPVPYLIGVSSKMWYCVRQVRDLGPDTMIYDIDRQILIQKPEDIPSMPQGQELTKNLKKLISEPIAPAPMHTGKY